MKICKKCGAEFGFSGKINGKQVNLQNRKYCLDCSPYGMHNTKQIEKTDSGPKESKICKCLECGREYDYFRKSGHTFKRCNSCWIEKRRGKVKTELVLFKGGKCEHCGLKSESMCVYDFHHVDPKKKDISISGSYSRAISTLMKEVEKCLLLCSNCHRIEHERLRSTLKFVGETS